MSTSITIKALKVTVVLSPDQIPTDSAEWILKVGDGDAPPLTLSASISPKSHRKVLQASAALGENAIVLLQGKIAGGDGVLRDTGLTVTERKSKGGEAGAAGNQAVIERGVPARVKFFSEPKGFGFVTRQDGDGDAFLPLSALEESGVPVPKAGTKVEVDLRPGPKSPIVVAIRLLPVPEPADASVAE